MHEFKSPEAYVLKILLVLGCIADITPVFSNSLFVDRQARMLYLLDDKDQIVVKAAIGIGKGGLKRKANIADCVTPTGQFLVDIVLYYNSAFNRVSKKAVYSCAPRSVCRSLLANPDGLAKLFNNMNKLDFNRDGKPDRAYGDGYIGITRVGLPQVHKTRFFTGTPYWLSIALHGTPFPEKDIGKANSGGCIHLDKDMLSYLIENNIAVIGTKITIADHAPPLSEPKKE